MRLERNAIAEVYLVVGPILAAILVLVNLLPIPSVTQVTRTAAHPLVSLLAMEQCAGLVLESVILRRYAAALLLVALPILPPLMVSKSQRLSFNCALLTTFRNFMWKLNQRPRMRFRSMHIA